MSIVVKDENWLSSVKEDIVDPDRRIIDSHHHLWRTGLVYQVDDLWRDTESGHNIVKTVFVDCEAEYRATGDSPMTHGTTTIRIKISWQWPARCLPRKLFWTILLRR